MYREAVKMFGEGSKNCHQLFSTVVAAKPNSIEMSIYAKPSEMNDKTLFIIFLAFCFADSHFH